MDIKQCDVKECGAIAKAEEMHQENIFGKLYDLCSSCHEQMQRWVEETLENGTIPPVKIQPAPVIQPSGQPQPAQPIHWTPQPTWGGCEVDLSKPETIKWDIVCAPHTTPGNTWAATNGSSDGNYTCCNKGVSVHNLSLPSLGH